MDETISKAEFALRTKVSRARVSQWITEGKISGAGLVGEGRHARIRPGVALAQLHARLDPGQRKGNGAGTDIEEKSRMAEVATVPLEFPFEHDGQRIDRVIIRRATADDCAKLADLIPKCRSDMEIGMTLVSVLCGIELQTVGLVDAEDFQRISEIVNDYAASFPSQGTRAAFKFPRLN